MAGGGGFPADRKVGYNDVLAAWNYYLQNDNKGRGVVLIGHSQGSGRADAADQERDRRQAHSVEGHLGAAAGNERRCAER